MYAYVKGILVSATPSSAVVDVQGVGYLLSIPSSASLPRVGESVCLYTTLVVRELSHTLYGFLHIEERELFEELIAITGIGPKIGLRIVGTLTAAELARAVAAQDTAPLVRVPGIGKKSAERLLVELQGKLSPPPPSSSTESSSLGDALRALLQLGLSQNAAEEAVKQAVHALSEGPYDLSTLVSTALRYR